MAGLSLLALATVNGYHGYVLFAWLYGFCLGGYQYAVHQYTLDRVRARQFARGWSLVLAVRSLPTLFGVPIAGTTRTRSITTAAGCLVLQPEALDWSFKFKKKGAVS